MTRVLLPLSLLAALFLIALLWRPGFSGDTRDPLIGDPQAHRHSFLNPYWPTRESPKLITPQWIGEEGVEAAAVLSIDDMRSAQPYADFLEPILQRLEAIDGRAPVSIFTNQIDPNEPLLQEWLHRGLSIEVHTIDHPCPLLQKGDFTQARETVHRCIDLLDGIPNSFPVAYRMPCCDSMNSVSPRFYADILGAPTAAGNFLSADSSVFQVFTREDPELPASLFDNGQETRFQRYLPLGKDFVNIIENYPYPYLIGRRTWQFPCSVPSDWEAQYLQGVNADRTVEDLKAALDATVAKKGLFVFVFHPHGWIENTQVAALVDHAARVHGKKLKFLNMREVQERIDRNLLQNQPIRRADGSLSGSRVLDVNGDGFMDVLTPQHSDENDEAAPTSPEEKPVTYLARIWNAPENTWNKPEPLTPRFASLSGPDIDGDGRADEEAGPALRFWDLDGDDDLDAVYSDAERYAVYRRGGQTWKKVREGLHAEAEAGQAPPPFVRADGSNHGVWMDTTSFIVQNEHTSDEPNVIRRFPFAAIMTPDEEPRDASDASAGLLEARPLEPQEALAAITTKPDLEVSLAAHEPDVMDPIDIAWGADGRLWVVEMTDYPLGIDDQGTVGGRVRYLEDRDADGRYETSTVFLEGLPYPTGVLGWRGGALVLAAPDLIYAEDTNGDGRADHRQVLYTGFGEGNQQHRINGLQWGLDNWVYLANGDSGGEIRSMKTGESVSLGHHDLRIRSDEGLLQLVSGPTQFGRNRNDAGDWFGNNNSNPLWHYVLDERALERNPRFRPPRPLVHLPEIPGNAPVFPTSVTHERFNDFHTANCITSACGTMIYRAGLLGEAYRDNAFVAEPVHNLVHRQVLSDEGVTFSSRRAPDEQSSEFFSSSDAWSRPVSLRTAPDGSLWVVDMYRHVIEHPEWIPHDWESRLDLRAGHDRGRLYRIAPAGHQPEPAPDLTLMDARQLIDLLAHDSGTVRDLAQQVLLERRPPEAGHLLLPAAESANWRQRLHALATLDGLKALSRDSVQAALTDPHPAVRRLATRLAGELKGSWTFHEEEQDLKVLLQRAVTLGELPNQGDALASLALSTEDPYLQAACVSSMLSDVEGFTERLFQETFTESHARLLRWVMSTVGPQTVARRLSQTGHPLTVWRLELIKEALPELADEMRPLLGATRDAALDRTQPIELRTVALEMIAASGDASTEMLANLCRPDQPLALQVTAVRLMAQHFPQSLVSWLLPAWPTLEPGLRQELQQWLGSRPTLAGDILDQWQDQPQPDLLRALSRHPDPDIRQRAEKLQGDAPSSAETEALQETILALPGDREAGKTHFAQLCASCHLLEGQGHPLGPDLATLTNPSPAFLLEAILKPNAAVEDKYLAYIAETRDGGSTIGLLEGESGGALQLRLANGESQEILRSDLVRLVSTGLSLMPEGLTAELAPQEAADLLAYVRSARPPRKAFPFNEPALVTAQPDGVIHLPATQASIHGPSLTFEQRYLHISTWKHVQDQAIWSYQVDQPGSYLVFIDYSCADDAAGNTLSLETVDQKRTLKIPGTGNWNGFQEIPFATVELPAGKHELVARSHGPIRDVLLDLRAVILRPNRSSAGSE